MSENKRIVSHESIVALANSLGITMSPKMSNGLLVDKIKECLYCNCVRMAVYIKMLKGMGAPKENAVIFMNSFLKEYPAGLTKAHKKFINELIFNLWVKKTTVAATKKKEVASSPLKRLPKQLTFF